MGDTNSTQWGPDDVASRGHCSAGGFAPSAELRLGMTDAEYFASHAHSCTMLKDFWNSREAYCRYYVERTEEKILSSSSIRVGSAVHDGLLQGFPIHCYPDECHASDGRIIPKRRAEYDIEHPDQITLSRAEYRKYAGAVKAIRSNIESADALRRAVYFETPIFWQDSYFMEFRCKPDWIVLNGDREVELWDLKVTGTPVEGDWEITAKKLRYDLQVVHYSEGATRLWGLPVKFKFVVVGNFPPHEVRIVELTEEELEDARWDYRSLLFDLRECYETGDWREPGAKHESCV